MALVKQLTPTNDVAALYGDHHPWLLGWLRRKLGGGDHAADLAQDTFVRVLSAHRAQRDLALREPRAYLTTVARGVLVNWYQRQALERAWLDALSALPQELAPSPEQRAELLQTLHEIDAMLDALPPLVRRAFLMSQIDGMVYEDIARELDLSLSTVKRHMALAFRQCLALTD